MVLVMILTVEDCPTVPALLSLERITEETLHAARCDSGDLSSVCRIIDQLEPGRTSGIILGPRPDSESTQTDCRPSDLFLSQLEAGNYFILLFLKT